MPLTRAKSCRTNEPAHVSLPGPLTVAGDAYAYCPPSSWRGTDSELTESHLPWFDLDMLKFTTPFFTSFTNSRVIHSPSPPPAVPLLLSRVCGNYWFMMV